MKKNFLLLLALLSLAIVPAGARAETHEHGAAPDGHETLATRWPWITDR